MSTVFEDANKCLQAAQTALAQDDTVAVARALLEHNQIIRSLELSIEDKEQAQALLSEQQSTLKQWSAMLDDLLQKMCLQRRTVSAVSAYLSDAV